MKRTQPCGGGRSESGEEKVNRKWKGEPTAGRFVRFQRPSDELELAAGGDAKVMAGRLRPARSTGTRRKRLKIRLREMKSHARGVGGGQKRFGGLEVAQDRVGLLEVVQFFGDVLVQRADDLEAIRRGIENAPAGCASSRGRTRPP
jgi:hypothetical protein